MFSSILQKQNHLECPIRQHPDDKNKSYGSKIINLCSVAISIVSSQIQKEETALAGFSFYLPPWTLRIVLF